jgi:hypothetical protein
VDVRKSQNRTKNKNSYIESMKKSFNHNSKSNITGADNNRSYDNSAYGNLGERRGVKGRKNVNQL